MRWERRTLIRYPLLVKIWVDDPTEAFKGSVVLKARVAFYKTNPRKNCGDDHSRSQKGVELCWHMRTSTEW